MAYTNILFISENTLKAESIVQQNVDSQLLTPFVSVAQTLHIEPLLGIPLTEELKNVISSGSSAITGTYETILVGYIQPAMVYYTLYEASPFSSIKWTNKSLSRKSSDNSDPIDLVELQKFRSMILNSAEAYKARLKAYLEQNSRPFPNYYVTDTSGMDCLMGNDKDSIFYSGIQLRRKPNINRNYR